SMLSASGFTAEDVRAIADVQGVESVMAGISQDVMMDYGESTQANIKLLSMPLKVEGDLWTDKPAALNLDRYGYDDEADWLGRPTVVEGRLPEQRGEIALDNR